MSFGVKNVFQYLSLLHEVVLTSIRSVQLAIYFRGRVSDVVPEE